jgi:hypothetical protein
VDGNPTYKLTKRLGLLKPKLKTLHHLHTSHISSCVVEANTKWAATLTLLNDSPQFNEYQRVKRKLVREFFQLSKGDKTFYKHRSLVKLRRQKKPSSFTDHSFTNKSGINSLVDR